jgi:hypothetical protein
LRFLCPCAAAWEWATYISYPRWTYEGLIINEFHHRPDNRAVLAFYDFEHFNKMLCFPILLAFIAVMNLGVYVALLPSRTRLEIEELTDAMQSPKPDEVSSVIIHEPVATPSSSIMKVSHSHSHSHTHIHSIQERLISRSKGHYATRKSRSSVPWHESSPSTLLC